MREGGLHFASLAVITGEMLLGQSMGVAVLHGIVAAILAALRCIERRAPTSRRPT